MLPLQIGGKRRAVRRDRHRHRRAFVNRHIDQDPASVRAGFERP